MHHDLDVAQAGAQCVEIAQVHTASGIGADVENADTMLRQSTHNVAAEAAEAAGDCDLHCCNLSFQRHCEQSEAISMTVPAFTELASSRRTAQ
jgi:hypothetical protein